MSVKTETMKPTAGISLFDAFGPNVSEEVDAITQRAAELSMADMVQVMGLPASGSRKLEDVETKDIFKWNSEPLFMDALSLDVALSRLDQEIGQNDEPARYQLVPSCSKESALKSLSFKSDRDRRFLVEYLKKNDVSGARKQLPVPFSRISNRDDLLVQEVLDSAAANIQQLLDVGVDRRSITVAIKYQDPKTGLPRTRTVEDDNSGFAGFQLGFKKGNQERKERKTAREYILHLHPASSKK